MSGADGLFEADWLMLREQADHAARSGSLGQKLAGWLATRSGSPPARIVDLGAGRGSNLRWLAPRLDAAQAWTLVDHDASLLEEALAMPIPAGLGGENVVVRTRLANLLDASSAVPDAVDVVTASALCDLVSEGWLEALAARLEAMPAAVLFALTVDGRRGFYDHHAEPVDDDEDRYLGELFNAHQRRGKGLGDALGPDAARILPQVLARQGLVVDVERADWRLSPGDTTGIEIGCALLEDWARAALEQAPHEQRLIERWHRRRRAAIVAGDVGVVVGHVDVLGLPR